MKIVFDTQIFDWQINGGISRYFIEVLNRLDKSGETDIQFKCRHSYNTYIQGTQWLSYKPVAKGIHFKGKLSALKLINQRINRGWSNRQLKKGRFDLFHPTYYDPYFLKHLGQKPFVLTVYDLTNEKFNDHSPLTEKVLAWKKELISRAAHIIAISENTRKDVIDYYQVAPGKVTTVYLSGGFEKELLQAPAGPEMEKVPAEYILFVGSRVGYKNYNAFVKELAPILKEQQLSLVTAGGGPLSTAEQQLISELGISNQVYSIPHASDRLLVQLYKKARVFVFPSLYEGFGLPVLEAMQCGCPTLLSNNSSLPEVGGGAACYFDPFKEGDLRVQLAQLLTDPARIALLKQEEAAQLARFSWEHTAAGHIEVYKKMLA